MNTKLVRCTLVLAVCLAATAAQAAFKVTAVPKPGEVPTKVKLPHVGITLNIVPKSPLTNVKNAARRVVSQIPFGKNFDREMDKIQENLSKQLLGPGNQDTHISAGEEVVLSRAAGFRDIHLPDAHVVNESSSYEDLEEPFGQFMAQRLLPLLPSADKLLQQFDGEASYDLLVNSMPRDILELDPMSQDFLKLTLQIYELIAKDQFVMSDSKIKDLPHTWNLDLAVQDASVRLLGKVGRPESFSDFSSPWSDTPLIVSSPVEMDLNRLRYEIFYAPEVDAPGFVDAIKAVSFTEYMVKVNDLNFPSFGQDELLDAMIVSLWHKMWTNELSPQIGQFLLKDYMYGANAHDIGAVMDEVYENYLLRHKFPGINFGAELKTLKKFCDNVHKGAVTPTAEELHGYQLGQEVVLLVRTLPESSFWHTLDRDTQIKVENMRRLLEGGLENGAQN